ncbi:unnamed protein product [Caretta caretta]
MAPENFNPTSNYSHDLKSMLYGDKNNHVWAGFLPLRIKLLLINETTSVFPSRLLFPLAKKPLWSSKEATELGVRRPVLYSTLLLTVSLGKSLYLPETVSLSVNLSTSRFFLRTYVGYM